MHRGGRCSLQQQEGERSDCRSTYPGLTARLSYKWPRTGFLTNREADENPLYLQQPAFNGNCQVACFASQYSTSILYSAGEFTKAYSPVWLS